MQFPIALCPPGVLLLPKPAFFGDQPDFFLSQQAGANQHSCSVATVPFRMLREKTLPWPPSSVFPNIAETLTPLMGMVRRTLQEEVSFVVKMPSGDSHRQTIATEQDAGRLPKCLHGEHCAALIPETKALLLGRAGNSRQSSSLLWLCRFCAHRSWRKQPVHLQTSAYTQGAQRKLSGFQTVLFVTGSGVRLPAAQKPITRQGWWKGKSALFAPSAPREEGRLLSRGRLPIHPSPTPLPRATTSLCSMPVSPFLFCR